jgi:hypothetical protein
VPRIYQLAGQPKTRLRSTPALLLRAVGVVNPTIRELLELRYEVQEPFIIDSTRIATKFDVHATPSTRPWPTPWSATSPGPAKAGLPDLTGGTRPT